jgi:hypothetical protein
VSMRQSPPSTPRSGGYQPLSSLSLIMHCVYRIPVSDWQKNAADLQRGMR